MNRALPALALGLMVAACAAPLQTSPPIAVPTATIPGNLCAHAQLNVMNGSSHTYSVNLNGGWAIVSEPGSDHLVLDYEAEGPPPLPWAVEVHDQQGRQVMAFTVDAADSAVISITDAGVAQTVSNLAAECSSSAPPSARAQTSGDPYAGLPSNACGGFHLKVVNDTSGTVTVGLNDAWASTIASGANQVITYPFTQPQPPMLPWHVTIQDVNGRTLYAAVAGDSPVDQKITLTNGAAPSQAPYNIALEGCGPA